MNDYSTVEEVRPCIGIGAGHRLRIHNFWRAVGGQEGWDQPRHRLVPPSDLLDVSKVYDFQQSFVRVEHHVV